MPTEASNVATVAEDSKKHVAEQEWWPAPLSKEEEELRKRAGRLLESLRRIPPLAADPKAWENDHEYVFSLFRRGCIDGQTLGMLEAPIYHNRQIEDAWLFLIEMRRRHPNRRKHVVECAASLGASYNWSMVLHGSKKIRAELTSLTPELQKEILEAANAHEILAALAPPEPAVATNGRRPSGSSGSGQALRNTWPQDAQPESGVADMWPQSASAGWPPAAVWPRATGSTPARPRKDSSLNPFGPADAPLATDGRAASHQTAKPPSSPGAQLLSASLALGEQEALPPPFPPMPPDHPSSAATSPGVPWQQGPSWASSPTSPSFNRPLAPNPHNPFKPMPRQQDPSHLRPGTPPNGPVAGLAASPPHGGGSDFRWEGPGNADVRQDGNLRQDSGAAAGDPAAIARSMAANATAATTSASRSTAAAASKAAAHGRNLALDSKFQGSQSPSSSSGAGGKIAGQASVFGRNVATATSGVASKASSAARSGVAAVGARTGSEPSSRTSSPDKNTRHRQAASPPGPASWAPPGAWASPASLSRRGADNSSRHKPWQAAFTV